LIAQLQTVPLAVPSPFLVGQLKQLPLAKVICVLVTQVGLPHDPPVDEATQLTPFKHPHEVRLFEYPVDFKTDEQGVHFPPTRMDWTGSHSHSLLLGLYFVPDAQLVA
jgi:hypothetical protein